MVRVQCTWACVPKLVELAFLWGLRKIIVRFAKAMPSLLLLATDSGKKKSSFKELKFSSMK